METYTLPYVKYIASGNLLYDARSSDQALCDNLEGWDGVGVGGKFKREGTHVYLQLIHLVVWEKPTQHCKAIILQLKTNYIYILWWLSQ